MVMMLYVFQNVVSMEYKVFLEAFAKKLFVHPLIVLI